MTQLRSLKEYFVQVERANESKEERTFLGEKGEALELGVLKAYEEIYLQKYNGGNKGIISCRGIFEPYLQSGSIDEELVEQWEVMVEELQRCPVGLKGDSLQQKLRNAVSYWLDKAPSKGLFDNFCKETYKGSAVLSVVGGGVVTLMAGLVTGIDILSGSTANSPPLGLLEISLSFLAAGGYGVYLGLRDTTFNLQNYTFLKKSAADYLTLVREVHLLAQKMKKEVADIGAILPEEADKMMLEYGKERIVRKEGKRTLKKLQKKYRALPEEFLRKVKTEGKKELEDKMLTAERHVSLITDLTFEVLNATKTGPAVLESYTPTRELRLQGNEVYDAQKAAEQEIRVLAEVEGAENPLKAVRQRRTQGETS